MSVTNDSAAPASQRSRRGRDGTSFLLKALRGSPAGRRMLSGVSVLLAVFALGLLAYPLFTNVLRGSPVVEAGH